MNDARRMISDFRSSVEHIAGNKYKVKKSFYIDRVEHTHEDLSLAKVPLYYDNSDRYVVFRKGEHYWDFYSRGGGVKISALPHLLVKEKYITLVGKYNEEDSE